MFKGCVLALAFAAGLAASAHAEKLVITRAQMVGGTLYVAGAGYSGSWAHIDGTKIHGISNSDGQFTMSAAGYQPPKCTVVVIQGDLRATSVVDNCGGHFGDRSFFWAGYAWKKKDTPLTYPNGDPIGTELIGNVSCAPTEHVAGTGLFFGVLPVGQLTGGPSPSLGYLNGKLTITAAPWRVQIICRFDQLLPLPTVQ